jgi:foldase protein PrsA
MQDRRTTPGEGQGVCGVHAIPRFYVTLGGDPAPNFWSFSMSYRALAAVASALLGMTIAGCSGGSGGGNVATVNSQNITRAQYDAKLESGPQGKAILNQLVQTALIDQYAADNHVDISDADVQKREDEIKSKYPPGQFETILKSQNLTEDDVKKILREQLVVEKAVGADVKIGGADVKAYLDKNHATLDTAEQVRAKHILVADAGTAATIEQKLKAGGDFAALAKQYSTDPSSKEKGGELGFFSKGQMVPAFQAAAFSQKIGVVGPPVKSPFGYHIIVVEETKPAQIATMANAADKIRKLLQQQQEQQATPKFLASLRAKANITINDDKLKDALPPVAPEAAATTATTPAPAASTK